MTNHHQCTWKRNAKQDQTKKRRRRFKLQTCTCTQFTHEYILSERSRFDLFLTHLRNKTTLTTTKWILIQCIHKHPVSGTPSWTTIDLTSLFIKSLSKLPKYCNAAKHSSNYQKLAMGFSIWPILIFKISHVCKLKWQHSPSSVTLKKFLWMHLKFHLKFLVY